MSDNFGQRAAACSKATRTRFHKATFEKIDDERKERILAAARAEFASKGFSAANVNDIARLAEISIGSMYSYFASKEDLFLTVVDSGMAVLEGALALAETGSPDPFELFERMLRMARDYARRYPELTHIYMESATQGLSPLSARLSFRLESVTADLYRRTLAKAREKGMIRDDLDDGAIAFFLDNILIALQFSFASDYYRERLRVFVGPTALDDDGDALIKALVALAKDAIAPKA